MLDCVQGGLRSVHGKHRASETLEANNQGCANAGASLNDENAKSKIG